MGQFWGSGFIKERTVQTNHPFSPSFSKGLSHDPDRKLWGRTHREIDRQAHRQTDRDKTAEQDSWADRQKGGNITERWQRPGGKEIMVDKDRHWSRQDSRQEQTDTATHSQTKQTHTMYWLLLSPIYKLQLSSILKENTEHEAKHWRK